MQERSCRPFWLWVNLLSLDAPLVALVWQDFLERCYPSGLRTGARYGLALTVWAIYLADRLIDVRHPAVGEESIRHRFYRQYSGFAKVLLAVVLCADLWTAVVWLRPAILRNGLVTTAAVTVYFTLFVFRSKGKPWKQASAALLFTAGVFLVAWTRTPRPWQILGVPAVVFCALCLGNLVLLDRWDRGVTTARGWIWITALSVLCAWLGHSRWYAAAAASGFGLALLDFRGELFSENARRVLADAVLLTPLLWR